MIVQWSDLTSRPKLARPRSATGLREDAEGHKKANTTCFQYTPFHSHLSFTIKGFQLIPSMMKHRPKGGGRGHCCSSPLSNRLGWHRLTLLWLLLLLCFCLWIWSFSNKNKQSLNEGRPTKPVFYWRPSQESMLHPPSLSFTCRTIWGREEIVFKEISQESWTKSQSLVVSAPLEGESRKFPHYKSLLMVKIHSDFL